MTATIRMGEATRKKVKQGWLVKAFVYCDTLRDFDDVIKFLCENTRLDNWLGQENQWDGKQWTWEVWALDTEGKE